MQVQLKHQPSYTIAIATLDSNEQVKVEPGAMVAYSEGMSVETKAEGGLFGGLKRVIGGESFFQNTYNAPAQGGELVLAPSLPGDVFIIQMSGSPFYLQSGAYIASEMSVAIDSAWGGSRGFFGGEGLVCELTGPGRILMQTRSEEAFLGWLIPKLPSTKSN